MRRQLIMLLFSFLLSLSLLHLGCALEVMGRNLADIEVKMTVNITSSPNVMLVCDVTGIASDPEKYEIQTFCPVVSSSKCLGNCARICSMKDTGECSDIPPILKDPYVQCSVENNKSMSYKKVTLIVDTKNAELAGEWYCKFARKKSAPVVLAHVPRQPSTTTTTVIPVSPTSTSDIVSSTKVSQSVSRSPAKPIWTNKDDRQVSNTQETADLDSKFIRFARADYVIGVLTLLAVSLIINLGFCIRCIFARHYVELRKRKQQPPGYLARCLCVSTVQVDEKEEAYEEIRPKLPGRNSTLRNSVRTTETTYMDGRMSLPRSTTIPPPMTPHQGLYYLQGVSDSMQRILYDEVPTNDSRPASPNHLNRHSRSRSSLRGQGVNSSRTGNAVPVVPEEVPFVDDKNEANSIQQDDEDRESQYSGSTRLELSRMMLRKADTLLKEANTLLKETAHDSNT